MNRAGVGMQDFSKFVLHRFVQAMLRFDDLRFES